MNRKTGSPLNSMAGIHPNRRVLLHATGDRMLTNNIDQCRQQMDFPVV